MKNVNTYISPALGEKLSLMLKAQVGIITAPAGYGKTTAALAALHERAHSQQHWFTAEKSMKPYENIGALKLCYAFYAAAKFDEYNRFLERLHSIISDLNNNQLLGEWLLVSAFQVFPDISKMTMVY